MKVDICNKKRTNPENSQAQTVFLREIEYESGTGEGLTFEITKELEIQHISMSKVLGFGSIIQQFYPKFCIICMHQNYWLK